MYLRDAPNDYGNPRSVFRCDTCGGEHTIDPAPPAEDRWMWQNCMAPECDSFDITRDIASIVGFGWGQLYSGDGNPVALATDRSE